MLSSQRPLDARKLFVGLVVLSVAAKDRCLCQPPFDVHEFRPVGESVRELAYAITARRRGRQRFGASRRRTRQ